MYEIRQDKEAHKHTLGVILTLTLQFMSMMVKVP